MSEESCAAASGRTMARRGNQPIPLPDGVKVSLEENRVSVIGPKGNLNFDSHPDMIVNQENGAILVQRPSDSASHRALHGTTRAVLSNMVHGVTEGYMKSLKIIGVGYNANLEGQRLKLALGFSHDIYF